MNYEHHFWRVHFLRPLIRSRFMPSSKRWWPAYFTGRVGTGTLALLFVAATSSVEAMDGAMDRSSWSAHAEVKAGAATEVEANSEPVREPTQVEDTPLLAQPSASDQSRPAGVQTDQLGRIQAVGAIVFAAHPNDPPRSFLDSQNNLTGLEADIAQEIAARLGVRAEFVLPEFEEILSGAWEGRWHAALTGMVPAWPLTERLAFAAIHTYLPVGLAVRRRSDGKPQAVPAKPRLGVLRKSSGESYLHGELRVLLETTQDPKDEVFASFPQPFAKAKILRYANQPSAFRALAAKNEIDAVLAPFLAIEAYMKRSKSITFAKSGALFVVPEGIAVALNEPRLKEAVRLTIADLRRDGTLRQLSERWYGADFSKNPLDFSTPAHPKAPTHKPATQNKPREPKSRNSDKQKPE